MKFLDEIIEELPPLSFVENFLASSPMERIVNRDFYKIINNLENVKANKQLIKNTYIMVAAFKDRYWEIINTGHFSKVDKYHRQLFTLATIQKTTLALIQSQLDDSTNSSKVICDCIWDLDNGLLLGCHLDEQKYCTILTNSLNILQKLIARIDENDDELPLVHDEQTRKEFDFGQQENGVVILDNPSLQEFKEKYFDAATPAILRNCMNQWPALSKWPHPQYLLNIANSRIIPIEVGNNYTNESWSQDLVKFQDFFRRQFLTNEEQKPIADANRIEYLAQHNLFEQIPALKNDILIPDYCCVSNEIVVDPDIKAWLGPKGTISPLHHDPKHNLLCQVFGHKRIILAAPKDSINVYPFNSDLLGNTSQIDAENLDFDKYPLVKDAKFYAITLYRGEMLYIPPTWWHYVRSLSKSFSVSFWWE